ncbi:MAG: T9SS type A sorting domain-containing protein [Flavobacteriales bacterium]|nr:T9SS type A sorting domain-containing protein [Flavobacteriales bacterium]
MKRFIHTTALVVCSLALGLQGFSQARDYVFTSSSGTFTPLSGGTNVGLIEADDQLSTSLPIGFNFEFEGITYTKVRASSNGFLQLDTTKTASQSFNDLDGVNEPIIAPLWDDLDGRATGGSSANYSTTGTSPNRIFTFEWLRWEWNFSASSPRISFQVKLYETTNKIEFIYRPDATSINSGSASIGLCGLGTGPGTFLSLDGLTTSPNASSSTETSSINTLPDSGRTYTFIPATCKSPFGIKDTLVTGSTATILFKSLATTGALYEMEYGVTSSSSVSTSSGVTTSGSTAIALSGLTAATNYTIKIKVVCGPGDTSKFASYSFSTLYNTPLTVDFAGFTGANLSSVFSGWSEGAGYNTPSGTSSLWTASSTTQASFLGSSAAKVNLYTNNRKEWIISPRFVATSTDLVKLKAAVTGYNGTGTSNMGSDDSVKVLVSNNGGLTWTSLINITNANKPSNSFSDFSASLGTYAGQAINVAFYAQDGPISNSEDYDFHITSLFIGTPPNVDMKPNGVIVNGCLGSSHSVYAIIENNSTSTIDFAVNNTTAGARISGAITANLSTILTSDTLQAGDTMHVLVGTANLSATGNYNFRAFTYVSVDGNLNNDTSSTQTLLNDSTYGRQEIDFVAYNGSNMSIAYPGWRDVYGVGTPSAVSGNWTSLNTTQKTHFGVSGAKVNLYSTNQWEWLISPKMNAITTDSLFFKAAIVSYNTTTTSPMGGDDSVDVLVSTDCGNTWNIIMTFDSSSNTLSNTLSPFAIPLGSYAGNKIYVAFLGRDGNSYDAPDYDFVISDVFIGTRPTKDFGVVALYSPANNACGEDSAIVEVVVKNFGVLTQTSVGVNVTVSGSGTATLSSTIASLAPDAMDTILVGKIPTSAGGTFNFKSYTSLSGDEDNSNDTNWSSVTILVVPNAPSVTNAAACTGSDTTFKATGGVNYRWYDQPVGGTLLSMDDTLQILSVLQSDTFYVETYTSQSYHVGPANPSIGSNATYVSYTDGLVFNALKAFTLDSVTVITGSSGLVALRLLNSSSTVIASTSVSVNSAGTHRIPVNFSVNPGTGYQLDASGTTVTSLVRNSSGASMPYTDAGSHVSIVNTINNLSGYYYFFYDWGITAKGCVSKRSEAILTMIQSPVINIGNDTAFCAGATFSVVFDATYATAAGFEWQDNSGGSTFAATIPGKYWCKVTDLNGCATVDSANIATLSLPTVNFPNFSNMCANSPLINLNTGTPAGGTYTGTNVSAGTYDPQAAGPGPDTLFYTYTDTNGCVNSDPAYIMIDSVTAVSTTSLANVCKGSAAITLSFGSPAGGVYKGTNVSGGVFTPTSSGSFPIRYAIANSFNCVDSAIETIVVDTLPLVTHSAIPDVCENTASVPLTGGTPSGGTYYGTAVSGSLYIPTLAGAGVDTVYYSFTDGNNCKDSVKAPIKVLAKPVVSLSTLGALCETADPKTLTEGSPANGTYSGTGVTGNSFDPKVAGVGTVQITYVFTNAANCTDTAKSNISVEANPVFNITGTKESCGDNPVSLSTSLANHEYNWSDGTTAATFTTKNSGQVWVKVTDTTTTSQCFAYDTVDVKYDAVCLGVDEALSGTSVRYFPNPNNGSFNFEIKGFSGMDVKINVFSANGQVVFADTWNDVSDLHTGQIELNAIESGMYFIHLTTEKGAVVHRIAISK